KECLPCSSYVAFTNALPWSNSFFKARSPRSLQLDLNCQRPRMADFNEIPFMLWYILTISLSIEKNFENHVQHAREVLNHTPFLFTEQALKEFDALKKAITMAPILAHFSELTQTLIKTNASDYAVAGVISHYISLNSTTRFMTRNFWKLFFSYRSGVHTFSVFQNLSRFLLANRLDGLNFLVVADASSRQEVINQRGEGLANNNPDNDCSISKNDCLLYKEKIVVPDNPNLKLSILKYNSPLADFSWPGMTRDVKEYVNSCSDCNRNKSSKLWKYGFLKPLPIPSLSWHSLS
ncbi:hypothetical protein VP01_5468g1, partial [Puccinia sorghi]